MTVKLRDLVPMLICDDVPASLRFYQQALGFEVVEHDESVGKSGWASIASGPVSLMLASPTDYPEAVKVEGKFPQSILYFYPTELEATRDRIAATGRLVSDIRTTFYGMREFDTTDPSGHVLWFGKSIDGAG